jgi:hypothetical protein
MHARYLLESRWGDQVSKKLRIYPYKSVIIALWKRWSRKRQVKLICLIRRGVLILEKILSFRSELVTDRRSTRYCRLIMSWYSRAQHNWAAASGSGSSWHIRAADGRNRRRPLRLLLHCIACQLPSAKAGTMTTDDDGVVWARECLVRWWRWWAAAPRMHCRPPACVHDWRIMHGMHDSMDEWVGVAHRAWFVSIVRALLGCLVLGACETEEERGRMDRWSWSRRHGLRY